MCTKSQLNRTASAKSCDSGKGWCALKLAVLIWFKSTSTVHHPWFGERALHIGGQDFEDKTDLVWNTETQLPIIKEIKCQLPHLHVCSFGNYLQHFSGLDQRFKTEIISYSKLLQSCLAYKLCFALCLSDTNTTKFGSINGASRC